MKKPYVEVTTQFFIYAISTLLMIILFSLSLIGQALIVKNK